MLSNISTKFKILIPIILVLVAVFFVIVLLVVSQTETVPEPEVTSEEIVEEVVEQPATYAVIGASVLGREIGAHTFGNGDTHIAFVGGIHGGYEWNSVLLAYEFIDYLTQYPEIIPDDLSISIIPNANPDGLYEVTGTTERFTAVDISASSEVLASARFNANDVDLNRNFDCKWQPESMWRGNVVSAGTSAFSEPEARAIRDFVNQYSPKAMIFWHSQAGAVYASECENGILPETLAIMNAYATAAGYQAIDIFDSYEITGDAEGWLASIGIPAITIELETRESIEWERNLAGFKSVLQYYSN